MSEERPAMTTPDKYTPRLRERHPTERANEPAMLPVTQDAISENSG